MEGSEKVQGYLQRLATGIHPENPDDPQRFQQFNSVVGKALNQHRRGLQSAVEQLARAKWGNFVLSKIVELFPAKWWVPVVVPGLLQSEQLKDLAQHNTGSRVLHRVFNYGIEKTTGDSHPDMHKLVAQLAPNVGALARSKFGNYVAQALLENVPQMWKDFWAIVFPIFTESDDDLYSLCKDEKSSHVVRKVIERASQPGNEFLMPIIDALQRLQY